MALPAFVLPVKALNTIRRLSQRPTLRLGPYRPALEGLSRVSPLSPGIQKLYESRRLTGIRPTHRPRTNWHRSKLPLYNQHYKPAQLGRISPLSTQKLMWDEDFDYDQIAKTYGLTPRITIRPIGHRPAMAAALAAAYRPKKGALPRKLPEAVIYVSEPNPLRPEANRRRKDQKVRDGYHRIHTGASLIQEAQRDTRKANLISDLWFSNRDPAAFLTGLSYFKALETEDSNTSQELLHKLYP